MPCRRSALLIALAAAVTAASAAGALAQETSPSTSTPTPAASASTAASDALRERVDAYLGAIDRPVPASAWKALGPDALPILEEVLAGDPITTRRAAAASAIAAIGGDRASDALLRAAGTESERWPVRSAAVRGLGVTMSPDRLATALRPMMERSPSAEVRAAAADALSRHAPAASCAAIRAQVARDPAARTPGFARAAARCSGR